MDNNIQIDKKAFFILIFSIVIIYIGSIYISYKKGVEVGEINKLPWNVSPTPTPTTVPQQSDLTVPIEGSSIMPEEQSVPPSSETEVACTMEAKVCPDGSAVGRMPPNCEFAPCP